MLFDTGLLTATDPYSPLRAGSDLLRGKHLRPITANSASSVPADIQGVISGIMDSAATLPWASFSRDFSRSSLGVSLPYMSSCSINGKTLLKA